MSWNEMLLPLHVLAALGCALVAGVFFAFSTFIMRALARLPPPHGIAAMQSINVTVLGPWFLGAFAGTAVACLAALAAALARWPAPGAGLVVAGSVLYLLGCVAVTAICNVPRNEALAAHAPEGPEAAAYWARYLRTWTAWNHVRTGLGLAAAAAFTLAS